MKKLRFENHIQAPAEKVWRTLWDDATYRQWTSGFSEGSYAVSDWQEGSEVQSLTPDGSGMYSRIARLVPNEFMSFEHLGELKNGHKEDQQWAGAMENYSLSEENGATTLSVDLDVASEEFEKYFSELFPTAMQKVKELSEKE